MSCVTGKVNKKEREDYTGSFLFTIWLPVVMTTSYPRAGAGLLPLEETRKSGRGKATGARAVLFLNTQHQANSITNQRRARV